MNDAFEIEYIRNLNTNNIRVKLAREMDIKKYQYCILNKGGIKYLF